MSATPKYRQVFADLKAKIESGELKPEDQLPSGTDLCAAYACSATVINTAMMLLSDAGLITGVPGNGRFVAKQN